MRHVGEETRLQSQSGCEQRPPPPLLPQQCWCAFHSKVGGRLTTNGHWMQLIVGEESCSQWCKEALLEGGSPFPTVTVCPLALRCFSPLSCKYVDVCVCVCVCVCCLPADAWSVLRPQHLAQGLVPRCTWSGPPSSDGAWAPGLHTPLSVSGPSCYRKESNA